MEKINTNYINGTSNCPIESFKPKTKVITEGQSGERRNTGQS